MSTEISKLIVNCLCIIAIAYIDELEKKGGEKTRKLKSKSKLKIIK